MNNQVKWGFIILLDFLFIIMTKKEFYDFFIQKPLVVYEIFKEYYDEDRVDFNDNGLKEYVDSIIGLPLSEAKERAAAHMNNFVPYILVYWPEVEVSNENGRSVKIKKLYAKVPIKQNGQIQEERGFRLARAEYTRAEVNSNYLHSHANSIPDVGGFSQVCLGDGPIRNTIRCLYMPPTSDEIQLDLWRLFCRELDVYVTVESLGGGPYHHLEDIRETSSYKYELTRSMREYPMFYDKIPDHVNEATAIIEGFCKYAIQHFKPDWNYGGYYRIGEDDTSIVIELSNMFITYANEHRMDYARLKESGILMEGKMKDGELNLLNSSNERRGSLFSKVGQTVLTFKGNNIPLVITETGDDSNRMILINPNLTKILLTRIITTLNYEHTTSKGAEANDGNGQVKIFL